MTEGGCAPSWVAWDFGELDSTELIEVSRVANSFARGLRWIYDVMGK